MWDPMGPSQLPVDSGGLRWRWGDHGGGLLPFQSSLRMVLDQEGMVDADTIQKQSQETRLDGGWRTEGGIQDEPQVSGQARTQLPCASGPQGLHSPNPIPVHARRAAAISVAQTLGRSSDPRGNQEQRAVGTHPRPASTGVAPAGQQQEVDHVVGDEAEAQNHAAPLLEALACREKGKVRVSAGRRAGRPRDQGSEPGGPV